MGCKQSTLKEQTTVAVAAKPVEPIVEAQSVVAQEQVQVEKETTQAPVTQEQSQPTAVTEPAVVEASPAIADVAPAEAPTPAPVPAPVEVPVAEVQQKMAPVSTAPAVQPATSAALPLCTPVAVTVHEGPAFATPKKALRDSTKLHNSPSVSKKTIVASGATTDAENLHRSPVCGTAAVSQEKTKRVAFAKRVENEGPKGNKAAAKKDMKLPRSAKSAKAHRQANVDEDRMKQMQMAFQRLLTNAAHLDYQLATR